MTTLILGGSTEASRLAALMDQAGLAAILSYAGRTRDPAPQPIPVRSGGFGGVPGLAAYLQQAGITALIDATHPFAARMPHHAAAAARATGLPHLRILRPPWTPQPGDRWTAVPSLEHAAAALGPHPRRVLLTIGQNELAPFRAAHHHHYVLRAIEPVPDPPPGALCLVARGPFDLPGERALLQQHRIEVIVSKNSGGSATRAKLDAARALGLAVILLDRPPPPPDIDIVDDPAAAMRWLAHAGTRRGA